MVNTKKAPDKYIIKRGTLIVYKGRTTSFNDSVLHSSTDYSYTVEAWLNGRVLTKATHYASTKAILVNSLEITAAVQPDDSVVLTWSNQNPGLAPDQYNVFVDGTFYNNLTPSTYLTQTTILDLRPGNHVIKLEGWYQDETGSQGSALVTTSEPIVAKPINVTAFGYADFSADIKFSTPSDLQIDKYKIFINEVEVFIDGLDQASYHIPVLSQGQNFSIRIEAYYKEKMVGLGSTTFLSPHKVEITWDNQVHELREMQIYFNYDDSLLPVERMVITRKTVTIVDGVPTEDSNSEVILFDGELIKMYTESQFNQEVARYNYYVVNYQNDKVVGSGNGSVPNFFDY
ncbi:hypothetical protein E2R56_13350 [Rhodococcus qingshengii]|nr:hypothetical protein E2R56_13350 [Rhodococcus qingshengii]